MDELERGKKLFSVTVREVANGVTRGQVSDTEETRGFCGLFDMARALDILCEARNGPVRSSDYRSIKCEKSAARLSTSSSNIQWIEQTVKEARENSGKGITFQVEILYRINATLQGRVRLMREEWVCFRSAFELMYLIREVILRTTAYGTGTADK